VRGSARAGILREKIWRPGIAEGSRSRYLPAHRDLLGAGQKVVRVPTKLMARVRKSARTRGI